MAMLINTPQIGVLTECLVSPFVHYRKCVPYCSIPSSPNQLIWVLCKLPPPSFLFPSLAISTSMLLQCLTHSSSNVSRLRFKISFQCYYNVLTLQIFTYKHTANPENLQGKKKNEKD